MYSKAVSTKKFRKKFAPTLFEQKLRHHYSNKNCANIIRTKVAPTLFEQKLRQYYSNKSCADIIRTKVAPSLFEQKLRRHCALFPNVFLDIVRRKELKVNQIKCDKQGCMMVCFQTKNPILGKFWRALEWKMRVYFMVIWNILLSFGIFYGYLVIL
jgi:hypothetical protein